MDTLIIEKVFSHLCSSFEGIFDVESTKNKPTIITTEHTTNTTDPNIFIKTPILIFATSNNYYDNIDNKILQYEYEGTIVFED